MAERLRRQVKVSLAQIPGHESGVGSSPTLINICLSFAVSSVIIFLPTISFKLTWRLPIRQSHLLITLIVQFLAVEG
jgi:hypothetical protein